MTKIILCADDSVTMQQVAEVTFKGTDYTYVGARSADEALAKAKQQKPVLVLADAVMPGKTGYELCQALKSDGALADVPVVILCGNSQAYDPARGAQVGADGTLSKPWDTQVMLDKIGEFIEKGSTGRASAAPAAAAAAPKPPVAPVNPAAAAAVAGQRSATIMGMPSIKLPPQMGAAPVVAAPVAPPPVAPVAKAPEAPKASPNIVARQPAPPSSPPPLKPAPSGDAGPGRAPLVAGIPTKRSALVERTLAKMAARLAELSGLEPGSPELLALLKLSTEVVERIVWEVVPDLAEQIIRENLHELAAARRN
jgi:CheY-like chemotaxis protein